VNGRREVLSASGDPFGPEPVATAETGGVADVAARPVNPLPDPAELADEARLRPRHLEEFNGQPQLTEHLEIVLEAARRREQPVDHLLFAGPPGLGKTSLAGIVAAEMGVGLRITSGPALVRAGDLAALLTDLQHGDVLFIDEIHRLPRPVEEVLYPAMEDFQLDILIGKGPTARSIRLDLPRFTLVGATTRTGLLTSPLRDRFGFVGRLDLYAAEDLQGIVMRSAGILGVEVELEGARHIASRARGTPRIANRLLRRVRDFVEVRAQGTITASLALEGLELFGVDELGLDKVDRAILDALCRRFDGRPVGLVTLAHCVGEEPDTVEDAYEPYLLQQGLLQRTPRGRMATPRAFAHLGEVAPSAELQGVTPTLW
jgi:holliday junction DNA helicase RuvB